MTITGLALTPFALFLFRSLKRFMTIRLRIRNQTLVTSAFLKVIFYTLWAGKTIRIGMKHAIRCRAREALCQ